MSDVNFMLAQIFGTTATILLCSAYFVKSRKTFLLLGLCGDLTYGLTFIFVNSWGAGLITLLSCLQTILAIIYENKDKKFPKLFALFFIPGFIILGLMDYNSFIDIIPIITYIWFAMALYKDNLEQMKVMYLIANLSLVIYDIMVMAYTNALEDGIESMLLLILLVKDFIIAKSLSKTKTATLKKQRLLFGEIGIKNNSQSANIKAKTSDNHNRNIILSEKSVNIMLRPCYKYG